MRAVTLADSKVRSKLANHFVCGWRNIEGKESYSGTSNKHQPDMPAIQVNTCAGHHNVQTFLMTSDGKVVNCLPGYWPPKAYLEEIELARDLDRIYRTEKSPSRRNEQFLDAHLKRAVATASTSETSELQRFDKNDLERRGGKDFVRERGPLTGKYKSQDQVVHERMAARPFLPYERFDTGAYIDMGRRQYRYNYGIDQGKKPASKRR